ncbi:MAG: DUF4142 domain-containing protein [Planctomycetota bacterium]
MIKQSKIFSAIAGMSAIVASLVAVDSADGQIFARFQQSDCCRSNTVNMPIFRNTRGRATQPNCCLSNNVVNNNLGNPLPSTSVQANTTATLKPNYAYPMQAATAFQDGNYELQPEPTTQPITAVEGAIILNAPPFVESSATVYGPAIAVVSEQDSLSSNQPSDFERTESARQTYTRNARTDGIRQNENGNNSTSEERNQKSNQSSLELSNELSQHLANKLRLGNEAIIELGELAINKANSDKVKDFAQRLVDDHKAVNDEIIREFPPNEGNEDPGSNPLLNRLEEINSKAIESKTNATLEMLNQYNDQEFDMGFIGIQQAGHTAMIAALESMSDSGNEKFQKIVDKQISASKEHLKIAENIAESLYSDQQIAAEENQVRVEEENTETEGESERYETPDLNK